MGWVRGGTEVGWVILDGMGEIPTACHEGYLTLNYTYYLAH